MIQTREFAGLEGLMLVAKRLVEGLYAGGHATPQAGPGVEFHDYRSYAPGDDPRGIDWKVYGRTNRLYLRRYRWFADFTAMIMVDCSASMHFAGIDARGRTLAAPPKPGQILPEHPTKLQVALALSAAISFLTIRQADRCGVGVYARDLVRHRPIGGTWSHLFDICRMLETVKSVPGVGNASLGLKHAHDIMKRSGRRRGIVVLISDLLEEPEALFDGLNRLRHDRFEVIVFQLLTPQELNMAGIEQMRGQLVDPETRLSVRTFVPQVRDCYAELIQQHIKEVRRGCLSRGVDHNLLTTDQSVVAALRRYVMRRAGN